MRTFKSYRDRIPTDSHCLYRDQQNFNAEYAELKKDMRAKVCIIGAGFTGVMASIYLARQGIESILIERHRVGWGASGRNGGQVIPGFNADPRNIIRKYGLNTIQEIYRLNHAAAQDLKKNIRDHAPGSDYRQGLTIPALNESAHKDQHEYTQFMKDTFGYDIRLLDTAETARNLGSDYYHAGMEDLNGGHFNPLKYLNQMAAYGHNDLGVKLYENTPAVTINPVSGGVEIETPYGTIHAKKLIIAGGAYLGSLVPDIRKKYVLVRTSMLATQVLDEGLLNDVLPVNHAVYEWRKLLNYYVKTPDGRLVFGGGDSAIFSDKKEEQAAFQKIYQDMVKIFPKLKDVHINHWWGGYIDVTVNDMPEVNRLENRLLYATGFCGHGVVPTHMAARLLAEMAIDDEMENPMAALKSLSLPGAGKYDYTLAKLGLLWARAQDKIS